MNRAENTVYQIASRNDHHTLGAGDAGGEASAARSGACPREHGGVPQAAGPAPALVTIFLSALIILQPVFCFAKDAQLIASSYSDRYHRSTCKIAQKIHSDDLVAFESPEQAFEAGYGPCKKCNPPVPKGKESKAKYNFSKKGTSDEDQES